MKICQYKSCLARPVIIINHFTVKLMPSGRLRAPVIRLFITVRSRFQPKTQIKHFPQFLKRGREATACSCVCNGEGVSYQTGSGLLLLIAQVYPQFDSTDGDSPLKTHTRPKVTVTLTTHTARTETASWNPFMIIQKSFSCSRRPFPNPQYSDFHSCFHVNVADSEPTRLFWNIKVIIEN